MLLQTCETLVQGAAQQGGQVTGETKGGGAHPAVQQCQCLEVKKVLQWTVRAEQCSGVVGGGGETKGRRQADHLD